VGVIIVGIRVCISVDVLSGVSVCLSEVGLRLLVVEMLVMLSRMVFVCILSGF